MHLTDDDLNLMHDSIWFEISILQNIDESEGRSNNIRRIDALKELMWKVNREMCKRERRKMCQRGRARAAGMADRQPAQAAPIGRPAPALT